ncbi:hypothetical protein VTN49DRAFT_6053 [Thermomyces lanuginosus]|uniref:uncharacterized protein n=1 Tax=Thermomyces lanuginosus TaxID=5541 RepID=UPI0037435863
MSAKPPLLQLIRAARAKGKESYKLHVSCHVKPNANARREGIIAVDDDQVEICVSAVPRDGEANAAVTKVLAEVLKVPKSDVSVVRGGKTRDKVLCVEGVSVPNGDENAYLEKIKSTLTGSVVDKK